MTSAASDPTLAIAAALASLRGADDLAWSSDVAATFLVRLDDAKQLVVGVAFRVTCAEDAITQLAAAA